MSEEVFIHKLNQSGSSEHQNERLFCRSNWIDESLYFTVLGGSTAWAGQLEMDDFKALMDKTGGRLGDVKNLAKEAFTSFSTKFAFAVDSNKKKLVWKKMSEKAIKIKITEIDVAMVNFQDTQQNIMDFLINSNANLKKENEEGKKGLGNLSKELNKAKEMLVRFEQDKNEIEEKLYGQFLPILNAKKRKICELERGQIQGDRNVDDDQGELSEYGSETDNDDDDYSYTSGAKGEKRKSSSSAEDAPSKVSRLDLNDSLDILNDSIV